MRVSPRRITLLLAFPALVLATTPLVRAQDPIATGATGTTSSQAERPRASNKWRIAFDERAKSSGTISFRIWPANDAPFQVDVAVTEGESENRIASTTRNALRDQLGEGFHVEVDDGEDVLVKARHGTGDFGLELLSSTARDVDITIRRE
ncbi:hypothetical protein [Stenotrophomonas sp. SY1]|jgi:hypothetical protein|uniref:hypothetical protein n=1 Tax=Stenotrophomonas sp. SY1 TaxID=477235 RepID=UPI001E45DE38|nr:hypothetical protein [Stenotrophomonas sp. SY1]MCD9087077.1 hypothetical protein [Stenotrophomonas sp. SY1]